MPDYDDAMTAPTPSGALRDGRAVIRALAARHRRQPARLRLRARGAGPGRQRPRQPTPETTLFDLGGLQDALEAALRVRVDLRTPLDLPPHIRARVLDQAVPV